MGYSEYSLGSLNPYTKLPWRNGLARWTSNSKVGGSSLIGGVSLVLRKKFYKLKISILATFKNVYCLFDQVHYQKIIDSLSEREGTY